MKKKLIIGLILGTVYNIFMSKIKRKNLVGIILDGGFLAVYFYFVQLEE